MSSHRAQSARARLDGLLRRFSPLQSSQQPAYWRLILVLRSRSELFSLCDTRGSQDWQPVERLIRICNALAYLEDRWVREPESWECPCYGAAAQFQWLISHLLAREPLPVFLLRVWLRPHQEWERELFLHLAAGHPLQHFRTPIPVSGETARWFVDAPDDLTVEQALRWGQVRGLGGSSALARLLATETFLSGSTADEPFCADVIRFFVEHPDLIAEEVKLLSVCLAGAKFPDNPDGRNLLILPSTFSMWGQTLPNLQREMQRMQGFDTSAIYLPNRPTPPASSETEVNDACPEPEAVLPVLNPQFCPYPVKPVEAELAGYRWRIELLETTSDLYKESVLLQHNLSRFGTLIDQGHASFWSLKQHIHGGWRSVLTLQVHPFTRIIRHARGYRNAPPQSNALLFLKQWALREQLQLP